MSEEKLYELTAAARDNKHAVASLERRMNQRFDEVDRRFDRVDRRFEAVDRRFGFYERILLGIVTVQIVTLLVIASAAVRIITKLM